jgi:hypothetical protein
MSTSQAPDAQCAAVRHLVATIAYRAAKVLRGVPPEFAATAFGATTRTPVRIVAHMGDLMLWAMTLARGENLWVAGGGDDWEAEVQRFLRAVSALDAALVSAPPTPAACEKLIQGPLADALTHVGQLAMLRGMAGAAVRPENYAKASVVAGRVGLDQPAPAREFDGDASVPRPRNS